jgi:hypothetical protein
MNTGAVLAKNRPGFFKPRNGSDVEVLFKSPNRLRRDGWMNRQPAGHPMRKDRPGFAGIKKQIKKESILLGRGTL